MKGMKWMMTVALLVAATACSPDEPGGNGPGGGSTTGGEQTGTTVDLGEVISFDIAVDSTSLAETESIDPDDEDYIENNEFTQAITITYHDNAASVDGTVTGVSVETDGCHVTVISAAKGVNYVLSGSTSNGSFKIYGDKKFQLTLDGVSITNPTGAAVNSQCKKRCYVLLADGTHSQLADGADYATTDDEDMKGTLFAEGKLLFSGNGHLKVAANYKFGICSDDYILFRPGVNIYVNATAGSAIKANDAVLMRGGVVNVECSAPAAKGMKCDGFVQVDGGRFTALTTGAGEWDSDEMDVNASAGIKADSLITINGGTVLAKSTGRGGKGISSDQQVEINGGTVKVITTNMQYTYNNRYTAKSKGIKADGDLTINGGDIMVRTTGGEGSEGIESKGRMTINDGTVEVYAYDDAINSAGNLAITGGKIFAYATNNDGIDTNGTLTVAGGTVIACGTTQPEDGFDCDQNAFVITGGTVVGLGGGTTIPSSNGTTQPVVVLGGSNIGAGTLLTVSGNGALAFTVPRAYNSYTLVVSSPVLTKGGACNITTGASISGAGTSFHGLTTATAVSGGSSIFNATLSNFVTTSNYSGGMGGGGGWGRW